MLAKSSSLALGAVALLALPLLGCSGAEALPAPDAQSSDTASLRAAYIQAVQGNADGSYAARPEGGTLVATNAAQRFSTSFSADGLAVTAGEPGASAQVSLALSRYGCASASAALPDVTPTLQGARIEYRRPGVTEWYVNGPLGLEQGFTLSAPPACDGREAGSDGEALVLELSLTGDFVASKAVEEDVIRLRSGGLSLQYGDLFVHDAEGRVLDARLALNEGRISLQVEDDGAAYPITVDPLLATEDQRLEPAVPHAYDNFGIATDIDGNTAAIGAYRDDTQAADAGAVYIFNRVGGVWTFQQLVTASDGLAGDNLGLTVSLAGTTLVASATGRDQGGTDGGAFYVFDLVGGTWTQSQRLGPNDPGAYRYFGRAVVSAAGDTIVVGNSQDTANGTLSGSTYVFERSGGLFSQTQKLLDVPGNPGRFGSSAAIDGTTLVVGAANDATAGPGAGAAFVYVKSGASWVQTQKLVPSDAAGNFGKAVSISGNTIVVGADYHDTPGTDAGAAYVFTAVGGVWTQTQKLQASDTAAGDYLGSTVAVEGDLMVLGAALAKTNGSSVGAVYVFFRVSGTWLEALKLGASDPQGGSLFGEALSISNGTVFTGARDHKTAGVSSAGAAYAFDIQVGAIGTCLGAPDGTPCPDADPCTTAETCQAGVCVSSFGPDGDADAVCDVVDNCVGTYNPTQLDMNADGHGDACVTVCFSFQRGLYGNAEDARLRQAAPNQNLGAVPLYTGAEAGGLVRSSVKFDLSALPPQSLLSSSVLRMGVVSTTLTGPVYVHRVTAAWSEGSATWNNLASSFDPLVEGTFLGEPGARTVSLLPLTQAWVSGNLANNGVMLEQDSVGALTSYGSSEAQWRRPRLDVCFKTPGL
jgi:hypothetical protein